MDKVIIDKVDVSECKFRLIRDNKQKCECCHATGFGVICNCESWYDCYYKQLKRLQAEYDDLHLSYAGCKTANTGLQELNEKLQAENEQLKKQYNCYACDSCGGKEDYINMKRHTENAIKTVHKYRQALQEIREIAERTDGNHPASVINMVSVIRHTINTVIGAE